MKSLFKALLSFLSLMLILVAILTASAGWWSYNEFTKAGKLETPVIITIPRGANIGGVADMLRYQKAIDSYAFFIIAGRLTGQASKIKAGEYEFQPSISMKGILDQLEAGKTVQRQVTIPEGLTNFEIINILFGVPELDRSKIEPLSEGALLPETYSYVKGETVADILHRMSDAMQATLDELWSARSPDLPITTKEEALILASIIEKETGVGEERKKVAGVFINRLRKGMLLQTDPTVIYALTEGRPQNNGAGPLGRRLLRKDLEIDSPYNTYRYAGLPPTPIDNPGRASIEAALNPEEHDYIYFVADGNGGHVFSKTLEEHNANVAKWRKIRAQD